MLSQEVAKKYAGALFMSVKEKNLTEAGYEQFNQLKDLVTKDPSLINFLTAPQVLDEDKYKLVRDIFSSRIEKLFVEFLAVLIDKNRVSFLPEIIDEFNRLIEAEKGIGRVTVISAVALSDAERSNLIDKLGKKTGFDIVLEEKLDSKILGGMIIILHNEIIDGSVKHGLDILEEQLTKARVN